MTSTWDLYIDGAWRPANGDARFAVTSPGDGEVMGHAAAADESDATAAVEAAERAFGAWSAAPQRARAEILRRTADLMLERAEEIARDLSRESGKRIGEAEREIALSARQLYWFAEEAIRVPGEYWGDIAAGRDAIVVHEPVGVVTAITPWNYPMYMVVCKAGAALAAGCTVVLKPSEQTPVTAVHFVRAAVDAGMPAGALNLVTARFGTDVAGPLVEHPAVACISFTGSRPVGRAIADRSSTKRHILELGGSAPFIVLDDADVQLAVDSAIAARFVNAGQACVAANRILVHRAVAQEFTSRFHAAVAAMTVGSPLDPTSSIGPLINDQAARMVEHAVDEFVAAGAELLPRAPLPELPSQAYVQPAVVVGQGSRFADPHEVFGPVALVLECEDDAEAIALANSGEFGLAAYVFSGDVRRALSVAKQVRAGSVAVNSALISDPALPFGGVGESGRGRERGRAGMTAFLETKTIQLPALMPGENA